MPQHYKGNSYSGPERTRDESCVNDAAIRFKYKFCSQCAAPMVDALREHRTANAGFDPTTGKSNADSVYTSRVWRCSNFSECFYATPYESYSYAICDCSIERHDSYSLATISERPSFVLECSVMDHDWTKPGDLTSSGGGPYRACRKCGKPEERKHLIWSVFKPWVHRCRECDKRWFQYGSVRGTSRGVCPHCGTWKFSQSYGRMVGDPTPIENTLVVGIPSNEQIPVANNGR